MVLHSLLSRVLKTQKKPTCPSISLHKIALKGLSLLTLIEGIFTTSKHEFGWTKPYHGLDLDTMICLLKATPSMVLSLPCFFLTPHLLWSRPQLVMVFTLLRSPYNIVSKIGHRDCGASYRLWWAYFWLTMFTFGDTNQPMLSFLPPFDALFLVTIF